MSVIRFVLVYSIIFGVGAAAFAQDENCEITLTHATEEFQAGHFYSIPAILGPCLNKFTPEQKQRANLLLTQTYLLLDDPFGAKQSYLEVLRANPEFIADPNIHPMDVVYLSKKFTASAVLSWFAKGGTNISPIWIIHDNDIFGQASAQENYRLQVGYQVSAGGDLYLYERFAVRSELNYTFSRFEHNTTKYFEEDKKKVNENQTWLTVPVMIMYHKDIGKYRPYGYAGYSVGYLARDIVNITIENIRTAEVGKDEKESPDLNFIEKRNRYNQSVVVGGGVKLKLGTQFLFVDVRYSLGLKNIVNEKNLYTDNRLQTTSHDFIASGQPAFSYAHIDDYFRIDNMALSFGFLQPLYKPRELKRSRSRSMSKQINGR
jgi:hypothetical protein